VDRLKQSRIRCYQASGSLKTFAWDPWGSYFSDWVSGATSGAVTTFVVVAAVVGANQPAVVAMVLGLANLAAIGFATAARRYGNVKSAEDSNSWHAKPVRTAQNYDATVLVSSPVQAAVNTFAAFILFGLIPLITYLLAPKEIALCIVATASVLFAIGAIRGRYTLTSWWRSGLDALLLGMCAAALAFAVGHSLQPVIGAST
jgi:vacuolar iron transporter family protein